MRAAIYVRISADRGGEGLGVERQREDCEALAERRGWPVAHVYVDNDISATSGKRRPEWEAMMAAVESGTVDVVVGWTIDRTLRTGRDRLRMLEAGKARGITISIVRGSDMDLSTPAGRLAADILGAVAQNEVEVKSERQIRAHRQAAEQGRRIGGRRPFGYDIHGAVLNPDEAQALRDGYLWVQQGVPLAEIARRWNAAGLITGKRRHAPGHEHELSQWKNHSVRRVLMNPRNFGRRRYKGELMEAPAQWPAIVDEATWRDVNDILSRPERRTGTTGARQLLTGVGRCGVCGMLVHGGGASHKKRIYRCRSTLHIDRLAEPVDDYVLIGLVSALGEPEAFDYIVDRDKPDLDALRAEATRLNRELREMAEEFTDDPDITPGQLRVMTRRVKAKLEAVEQRMVHSGRLDLIGPFLNLSDEKRAAKIDEAGVHVQRSLVDAIFTVELFPVGRGTRIFRPETIRMTPR